VSISLSQKNVVMLGHYPAAVLVARDTCASANSHANMNILAAELLK
jgi:hypothetical protein